MRLTSLILIRHSLRLDCLSPESLVQLLEQLLDDELLGAFSRQHGFSSPVENYDGLYQLLVKILVTQKCLEKYMETINNTQFSKLHKLYDVLSNDPGYSITQEFISTIKTQDQRDTLGVSLIDHQVTQFGDLAYKQC